MKVLSILSVLCLAAVSTQALSLHQGGAIAAGPKRTMLGRAPSGTLPTLPVQGSSEAADEKPGRLQWLITLVQNAHSDARAAARKLPTRLGLSQSKNDDTTVPHRLLQQTTGTVGSVRSVGNQGSVGSATSLSGGMSSSGKASNAGIRPPGIASIDSSSSLAGTTTTTTQPIRNVTPSSYAPINSGGRTAGSERASADVATTTATGGTTVTPTGTEAYAGTGKAADTSSQRLETVNNVGAASMSMRSEP